MASNRNEPERPFGKVKYPGVVGADQTGTGDDSIRIEFGNEDGMMEGFAASNHEPDPAYQVPQPPQAFDNSFVTQPYTPKDWKAGKPGA